MRGLAWRCLVSLSVKNACSVGAIGLIGRSPRSLFPGGVRPLPTTPARLTGTNMSTVGLDARDKSIATGRRASTSSPARYQPSNVRTANVCRRS